MIFIEVLIGLVAFAYASYLYLTRNFDYWEKRRVNGPDPIPFFGTSKALILNKVHVADHIKSIYDAYPDEPAVGLFARNKPVLLAKHPDIIGEVLIKHFTTFPNRGPKIHEDIDPLSQHLVYLHYERWKPLRRKLTPTFTSGRLRDMFHLIVECSEHFVKYMEQIAAKNEPVECRELTAKFTTDVIGVCAFGLNMNAMDNNSEFRQIGRTIFTDSYFNKARHAVRSLPHWMAKLLIPIARDDKLINFFVHTITSTMKYRKENDIRRNDFVDLLMGLRDNPVQGEEEMTDILLTAQAFVFFLAGYETSAAAMSHAMYELACHPEIQDQLRQEIEMTFDKSNGKINYDDLKNMKYLDKVLKETLRKYPPVVQISRVARYDHTFENSNISITKGTRVMISVYAIHHDSSIYPDPDKFDPERFDKDVANARPSMSYIPFGNGPRNCIGERFAQIVSKIGLIAAVKNFQLDVCDKTIKVYEKKKNQLFLAPVGGLYLRIKKL